MPYYVLITGSRSILRSAQVQGIVASLVRRRAEIVVGDAPGIDRLVLDEALRQGWARHVTVVGAYGRCRNSNAFGRAGRIVTLYSGYLARNLYMAGLSNECIAVWDGRSRGTKFTIDAARRAGLKTTVIYELPFFHKERR